MIASWSFQADFKHMELSGDEGHEGIYPGSELIFQGHNIIICVMDIIIIIPNSCGHELCNLVHDFNLDWVVQKAQSGHIV